MAEARKIIEFVFSATDDMSGSLSTIADNMGSLNDSVQDVAGPIGDFAERMALAEAAVVAAGVALAAFAVSEAGKFDDSMRELTTLVNGGETELKAFGDAVSAMGAESVASLEDLTGAMYKAVSQTGNLEDASEAVRQSEKLAVAGRADLTDTTLLLVGTLASYSKGMDDAAHFSDVLFSVVQNGQTTLPELASGLGNVAPTAASAGVSIEDLGAAIALLTKSGIGTSEAMTGVKAALANIIAPSREAEETAKALGINFGTAGIASQGFAGFMQEVAEKTGGSTDKISALFGSVEAFNSVMVLTQNSGADFNKMLDSIRSGAGSTERAYALMVDSFTAKNQQIENNLKLVAIAFGTGILDPVKLVQTAITNLLKSLSSSVTAGAFDPLIEAARQALTNLATTVEAMARALPEALAGVDFSGLIEAFRDLGLEIGSIFDDVDLTTPEGLRQVIQRLVDGLTSLTNITSGFVKAWLPVVDAVLSGDDAFSSLSPEVQKAFGAFGGAMSILSNADPLIKGVTSSINLLALAIGGGGLVNALSLAGPALAVLTGPVGIAVAGVAAVVASDAFFDWSGSIVNAGQSMLGLNPTVEEVGQALLEQKTGTEDLTLAMGAMIGSAASATLKNEQLTEAQQKHIDAVYAGIPTFDLLDRTLAQIGGTYVELADQQDSASAKVKSATEIQAEAIDTLLDKWTEAEEGSRDLSLAADLSAAGFKAQQIAVHDTETGLVSYVDAITFAGDKSTEAGDKAADALSQTAEETLKAQEAANDFSLEWEKIASEERQLIFQLSADIAIAQIEAGTERVKAAFESVNTTIESTGETLVGLAGILADVGSGSGAGQVIIDLMEEENERRKQALELQKQLVEAQIKYLDATTQRLNQGDAMITITSDGLEQDLEQFMMAVLKRVQVKASQEAQQFLLGLN